MAVPGHAAAVAMTAQVNLQHRRQPPRLAPTRPRATLAPMPSPHQCDFTLEPADNERLANLAGPFDAHLRQIELRLGVEIANRGNVFRVTGPQEAPVAQAERLLRTLYAEAGEETFDGQSINLRMNAAGVDAEADTGVRPASNNYVPQRSEEHTSELQSLMRISYAVFCLEKKKKTKNKL